MGILNPTTQGAQQAPRGSRPRKGPSTLPPTLPARPEAPRPSKPAPRGARPYRSGDLGRLAAVLRWEDISRGFDRPTEPPYQNGLCYAATETGPFDVYHGAHNPDARRIAAFLQPGRPELAPKYRGSRRVRGLRATVAAFIAAMIAAGDDPATPYPETGP